MEVYPFFEWLDGSLLAQLAKANGGVFVVVQTLHLLGLATLGGAVLLADLRLLGVLMREVPIGVVARQTDRWFDRALLVMVPSGLFMSSAVALKLHGNEMWWGKMAAFGAAMVFVYLIRRPLLREDHAALPRPLLCLIALTSLTLWFTVAASGRWIGFS